ncbi:MAG: hypothetical protein ABI681_05305 [Gemmatimonadales bacterium]
MSKRELLAAVARHRADAQGKADAAKRQADVEIEAGNAAEQNRVEQENVKVRAEAATLQHEETPASRANGQLRSEAIDLRARAAKATTDAELSEIHQRARQLLEQLRRR